MRKFMWNSYSSGARPTGPWTLAQIAHEMTTDSQGHGVVVSGVELDDLANLSVGESYCIPENPLSHNKAEEKQLGDFTRVE